MAKRKRSTAAEISNGSDNPIPASVSAREAATRRKAAKPSRKDLESKNQEESPIVLDSANAEAPEPASKPKAVKDNDQLRGDPEVDDEDDQADPAEVQQASLRPPPVNSDYLPLPWKGRLGYACLNTYLRNSVPPVFSSRTTRIASILEHRHPLADPSQPEHPTKNRPDKDKPADIRLGQRFIENLCLANVRDMAKMIKWNDRYGIKFLRLSSEAFPFASHAEYGYKLAPFAAEELAKVGEVAAKLGHRLTTHPGQFTQLGSPRKPVIDASFRDLEYHNEMLSLLKLPPQQDRDAVMILHMGGMFGDKAATLDRFRENYAGLSDSVKRRLVLENDDMCWSVHDLLPICQELNIPLVLDFHHHNIIFDSDKIREGSKDIMDLYPAILETWRRKNITPKMHYSEQTPPAITGKQRRKHSPRVATLPPCPSNMDLMIEAKDKEQAVFELMRTFKLPGWDTINNIVPHVRDDINKPAPKMKATPKKKKSKAIKKEDAEEDEDVLDADGNGIVAADSEIPSVVPEEELGMGGPLGRVYWPPGMEEWLRPVKRVVKKKEPEGSMKITPAQKKAFIAQAKAELGAEMKAKKGAEAEESSTPNGVGTEHNGSPDTNGVSSVAAATALTPGKKRGAKSTSASAAKTKSRKLMEEADAKLEEAEDEVDGYMPTATKRRASGRSSRALRRSYKE